MKNLLRTIKRKFNCSFNKYNVYYVLKKLDITYKKAHKIIRTNKIIFTKRKFISYKNEFPINKNSKKKLN